MTRGWMDIVIVFYTYATITINLQPRSIRAIPPTAHWCIVPVPYHAVKSYNTPQRSRALLNCNMCRKARSSPLNTWSGFHSCSNATFLPGLPTQKQEVQSHLSEVTISCKCYMDPKKRVAVLIRGSNKAHHDTFRLVLGVLDLRKEHTLLNERHQEHAIFWWLAEFTFKLHICNLPFLCHPSETLKNMKQTWNGPSSCRGCYDVTWCLSTHLPIGRRTMLMQVVFHISPRMFKNGFQTCLNWLRPFYSAGSIASCE